MRNIIIMLLIGVGLVLSACHHHHHKSHKKGPFKGLVIEEEILHFQNVPKLDLIVPPPESPKVEVAPPEKPKEEAPWWPWS